MTMQDDNEARAIKAVVKESERLRKIEERLIVERDKLHEYNVKMDNKQIITVIEEELLDKILGDAPKSGV
jgi:hypothetical protein